MSFRINWNEKRVISYEQVDEFLEEGALNLDFYYEKKKTKVDLSKFKKLRWLGCNFNEVKNLGSQSALESLVLFSYPANGEGLESLQNLTELVLRKGSTHNLSSVSNLKKLEKLEISNLTKLTTIYSITQCQKLEYLEIESCKKIGDLIETLIKIKNLKTLKLLGLKIIDLNWVKELENLQQLILTDTNILSGDISPAKNIDYVAIDNKRHYNYRFNDKTRKIELK